MIWLDSIKTLSLSLIFNAVRFFSVFLTAKTVQCGNYKAFSVFDVYYKAF
tara:strand:+ start:61949 stop:62098 length:150 start_codon:yes stop_codon:yes gene_type:complete